MMTIICVQYLPFVCSAFSAHRVVMDQMESATLIRWQWYLYSALSTPYLPELVCIFALLDMLKLEIKSGHWV